VAAALVAGAALASAFLFPNPAIGYTRGHA
jgi:hypothetical protein